MNLNPFCRHGESHPKPHAIDPLTRLALRNTDQLKANGCREKTGRLPLLETIDMETSLIYGVETIQIFLPFVDGTQSAMTVVCCNSRRPANSVVLHTGPQELHQTERHAAVIR